MTAITTMPFTAGEPTPRIMENAPGTLAPFSPAADAEAHRLTAAIARGDESAFQELYDRYHRRLFRLAVVLCRGNETLAHEVVQSVFLTAAAKLKPLAAEEHLWNWLARVARQHWAKTWRRQQREPAQVALDDVSPSVPAPIPPDAILEESLDVALQTLEPEDRQVVEWFYFNGMNQKEIAGRLNATPKAISSRLERARARLRSTLNRILSHET